MKKLLALLLVFTMLFALVACSGNNNNSTVNSAPNGENNSVVDDNDNNTDNDEDSNDEDSNDENSSESGSDNKEQDIYDENYVTPAEDFEWKTVTGGIEITAYNGDDKRVVVPEVIDNKKVVCISERPASPFDGNVLIEELILPKSISRVYITGCDNLRYLEMRTEELGTAYCTGWQIPESVEEWVLPNITVFSGDNARGPGDCFIPENSKLSKLVMPNVTGFALSENAKNIKEIVCAEGLSYIRYILTSDGKAILPFLCCDDDDTRGNNKAFEDSGELYIYDSWEDILICPIFGVESITINGVTYSK